MVYRVALSRKHTEPAIKFFVSYISDSDTENRRRFSAAVFIIKELFVLNQTNSKYNTRILPSSGKLLISPPCPHHGLHPEIVVENLLAQSY